MQKSFRLISTRSHWPYEKSDSWYHRGCGKSGEWYFGPLSESAGDDGRAERKAKIAEKKSRWAQQLSSMDHEDDDPGTTWNQRARADKPDWMSPRMAWRAIQSALPTEAIISSDIGNNCAIGNAIRL